MANDTTIYALSTCIHCRNTKDFLDKCGVEYKCIFVDQLDGDEKRQALKEVAELNPRVSFPTVKIGDEVIVGFKKDKIEEALKK